jgi:hypothetical protein
MSNKPIVTLKVEMWPIENLTPYELNVKKHEKDQVTRIAAAIAKSGKFDQPIVVDRHGVIIKGHGRRLAALELGMRQVPVVVHADLGPEEVRAMRLADNRVAISDIDSDMLKIELEGIDSMLKGIFDDKELDFIGADLGEVNEDAFVNDMGEVLDEQKRDMEERVERAAEERVPLSKAFGFKDVSASAQIHITRLMAKAQAATGLEGGEALAAYAAAL